MEPKLRDIFDILGKEFKDSRLWVCTDKEMNELSGDTGELSEDLFWIYDKEPINDEDELILNGAYIVSFWGGKLGMQWAPYPEEPIWGIQKMITELRNKITEHDARASN